MTYSHTALTPVLVKPGFDNVIPLARRNSSARRTARRSKTANLTAAQACLAAWGAIIVPLGVPLGDDSLYYHASPCDAALQGLGFILICVPTSPPTASVWV